MVELTYRRRQELYFQPVPTAPVLCDHTPWTRFMKIQWLRSLTSIWFVNSIEYKVPTSSLRYFFLSTEKVSLGVSKALITVRGSTVETVPFSFDVHSLTAITRTSFSMMEDLRFWLWTWSKILSTQACLCRICWMLIFPGCRVFFIEDLPLLHNYLSSSGTGPSKPARYLLASILTVSPESLKVDWIWDFKSISTSENSSAFRTDLEALWYDNAEWWWESIYKSCQHTFQVWLILSIIQNFKLVTKFFVIVISLTRIKH